MLFVHLGFRNAHPAGDRRPQPLDHDLVPDLVLELGRIDRRALLLEQLPIAGLADERAVHLEGRHGEDALADLGVAHLEAQSLGLLECGLSVDHLLQ